MQIAKTVKIRLWGRAALQMAQAAAAERVAATEILRRAVQLYFSVYPVNPTVEECGGGPTEGSTYPLAGPAAAPPSSPPPSSPPAPPLTPPSVSPPALSAAASRHAPAPGTNGLLFPELGEPAEPEPATPAEPEPAPPVAPPPLLLFPCIRDRRTQQAKETKAEWPLPAGLVARWEEAFPGMDVLGEARKAREWVLAHHLKTYNGMRAFLFRWLSRAQNSGRFMRRAAGSSGAAGGTPPSLREAHGFASWEEWETTLRQYFTGPELDQEILNLAAIRAQWEARHG